MTKELEPSKEDEAPTGLEPTYTPLTPQEIQAYEIKFKGTKFTKERVEELINSVKVGLEKTTACQCVNMSYQTLCDWEREKHVLYWRDKPVNISEALKNALGEFERWHLVNIRTQAKKDWRASGWTLERIKAERYAKKDTLQHTGAVLHAHIETDEDKVIGTMGPEFKREVFKALSNGNGKTNGKQHRIIDAETA